jgi:hypothetical protein
VNEFLSYLPGLFSVFVGDDHDTAISHSVQNGRELRPFSLIAFLLTRRAAAPTRNMLLTDLAVAQVAPALFAPISLWMTAKVGAYPQVREKGAHI